MLSECLNTFWFSLSVCHRELLPCVSLLLKTARRGSLREYKFLGDIVTYRTVYVVPATVLNRSRYFSISIKAWPEPARLMVLRPHIPVPGSFFCPAQSLLPRMDGFCPMKDEEDA
jgi:hypothetical protein